MSDKTKMKKSFSEDLMTSSHLNCVANRLTRLFVFYCGIVQSCHGGQTYRAIITSACSDNVQMKLEIRGDTRDTWGYRTEYQ